MPTTYSFENLVIKGGGIRGIAYLGALKVLSDKGILQNIRSVAGASAGAIQSLMVAMYHDDYPKLLAQANTLDFSKVPGIPSLFGNRTRKKRGIVATLAEIKFLRKTFGLHKSTFIESWFRQVLEERTGNPDITFAEFVQVKGCIDLHIPVSNISSNLSIICSAEETPDVKVVDAVRTSMSIPIFFETMKFNNASLKGYFGDGGVMNNYPIQLYDQGLNKNEKTLGLFLYAKEGVQSYPQDFKLKQYAGDIVSSLFLAQDWSMARHPSDLERSIQIYDEGVKPTSFDVKVGDPTYKKLVQSGKDATIEYLKNYDAGNKPILQKSKFSINPIHRITPLNS